MRHPTSDLRECDLGCLTGSSTASADKDNINNNASPLTFAHSRGKITEKELYRKFPFSTSDEKLHNSEILTSKIGTKLSIMKPTYLPELIGSLDWQKSRKRKERLDSTCSSTQDPKLQRSNSEELMPTQKNAFRSKELISEEGTRFTPQNLLKKPLNDVIRRVSSEDFKKTSTYAAYLEKELKELSENELDSKPSSENNNRNEVRATVDNISTLHQHQEALAFKNEKTIFNSYMPKAISLRPRCEASPTRTQHFCTWISNVNNNNINVGNCLNANSSKPRDSDESECENERRRNSERFCKARAAPGYKSAGVMKKGSNLASKYNSTRVCDENVYKYDLSSLKYERRGFISKKNRFSSKEKNGNDLNDNNLINFHEQCADLNSKQHTSLFKTAVDENICLGTGPPTRVINTPVISTPQESLPWDRSVAEDHTPVLSRRHIFASSQCEQSEENLSTVVSPSHSIPNEKSDLYLLGSDSEYCMQSTEGLRVFTALENLHTKGIIHQGIPTFKTPEERMNQINRRLNAMKKKLLQLELAFEYRSGYRPSQVDRFNDKSMKNTLSEINKLRKERHDFKAKPKSSIELNSGSILNTGIKLDNIKATLMEIENNLAEKRTLDHRPESLDVLSADQIVEEKTSLQHALLYFESLYGRPAIKEERDIVRPLYDRYRQLKRMVSRNVLISTRTGLSDLPTILEHEAMVFEKSCFQPTSNNSTETANSPNNATVPNLSVDASSLSTCITPQTYATTSNDAAADLHENLASMTIDQLWDFLERTREEKKIFKRVIKEYETCFEKENGRKMLKNDRRHIEETYANYKEKKAKTRLLQALIKKKFCH